MAIMQGFAYKTKTDLWMDAMYYICENGEEMLEEQAQYFANCLLGDESSYYVARMGGFLDSAFC